MKITDISVRVVRVPLSRVFVGSTYQVDSRCTLIVRVETDEGIAGEIYSGDERVDYPLMRELILERFRDLIVGENPLSIEGIWHKMFELTPHIANKRAAMRAISAVDLALWDLMGKIADAPLYRLLGGSKTELPIIGYTYHADDVDPEVVAELALEQREQGLAGTKLKVGGVAVSADIQRVEVIRKAVGDDFILACDANRAWTVRQSIEFARGTADLNIAWLEEPVRWHNEVEGMAQVRQAGYSPVTAGQSEISGFGCMNMMKAGAVDYLNVDASICGGITEWKRIASAAHYFDVGMVHHEEPQASVHLLSSIPHSYCAELFQDPERDPVWHYMYEDHPEIKDGKISPPERPGLGITLDQGFVEKYLVA